MNSLSSRKKAFIKLGEYLSLFSEFSSLKENISIEIEKYTLTQQNVFLEIHEQIEEYIQISTNTNPWFTQNFLLMAIQSIGKSLSVEKLNQWLRVYDNDIENITNTKTIGVVMAGNLPLVGFHDYLCVLISGNKILAKVSHDDSRLLPLLHEVLCFYEPDFNDSAVFIETKLSDFDAIIATGSDNTARYFEYYFGKYPNIIRKNRNGVAVLNGKETIENLEGLADDIFMYYGLGCRNVSKLFIPREYNFDALFDAFNKYASVAHHNKYFNNYEYNKSIFLINKVKHLDNGFVLLKQDTQFSSPISVLYFEYYDQIDELNRQLESQKDKIQCLISNERSEKSKYLPFGKAQQPELWDYADGIDTLKFILSLN